jgi:shikimate kinase
MRVSGNIFLVGPMGSGKSTIGRRLAAVLGKEFYDSDREIERRTGATVSLIFDLEGEAGFRARERAVIDELTGLNDIVLATGGGVVLAPENRRALVTRGRVVYLHAPLEKLIQRTARDRVRPLLQTEDRVGRLLAIVTERDPLYRQVADLVVETGDQKVQRVVREILMRLRDHGNAAG